MNIRKIVRNAIRGYITDSEITEAVNRIIENEIDLEDCLMDNSKLMDLVLEETENAINEELEDLE